MIHVNLDGTTADNLRTLMRLTGKPESDVLRDAVAAYLDDLEDANAADAADAAYEHYLKGEEQATPLEDLERDLGLAG